VECRGSRQFRVQTRNIPRTNLEVERIVGESAPKMKNKWKFSKEWGPISEIVIVLEPLESVVKRREYTK